MKPDPAATSPNIPPIGQIIFTTLGDAILAASATKLRERNGPFLALKPFSSLSEQEAMAARLTEVNAIAVEVL